MEQADSTRPRMVFHFPEPLDQTQDGASRIRPVKMLQAFRNLGYNVDVVAGRARDRSKAIRQIRNNVKAGVRYEFLYSESSTMPTLLTEPHHLPLHPLLDLGFLYWFRRRCGPVGLFYRDAHWLFIRSESWLKWFKQSVAMLFHWFDLVAYRVCVSLFFLPSLRMKRVLPFWLQDHPVYSLPSGCENIGGQFKKEFLPGNQLRLLYVGGVSPPLYDLAPMLRVMNQVDPGITLTICCRYEEWQAQSKRYHELLGANVSICHFSHEELYQLYATSDVFVLLRNPHPYLEFAVSFKVYEAMSHRLPLLVFDHEFAVADGLSSWGWAVNTESEAVRWLQSVQQNKQILIDAQCNLKQLSQEHAWEARANFAAQSMTKNLEQKRHLKEIATHVELS